MIAEAHLITETHMIGVAHIFQRILVHNYWYNLLENQFLYSIRKKYSW